MIEQIRNSSITYTSIPMETIQQKEEAIVTPDLQTRMGDKQGKKIVG